MHAEIKDSNEAFVLRYVPPLPSGGSGSQYQFLNGKISTQLKKTNQNICTLGMFLVINFLVD